MIGVVAAPDKDLVERYVKEFLRRAREVPASSGASLQRLPGWLTAAHVTCAWCWNTAIIAFDPAAQDGDDFEHLGYVVSDAALIFRTVVEPPSKFHAFVHDPKHPNTAGEDVPSY